MPGPQRKPTALRLVEGQRGHHRPVEATEPMPPPTEPEQPPDLTPEARKVWAGTAPKLVAYGVLTSWDGEAFGAFCEAVVARRRAVALIQPGLLVRGRDKELVVNPGWRVFRDATLMVARLGAQFGLTPASRSVLKGNVGLPEDDDETLFTPVRR